MGVSKVVGAAVLAVAVLIGVQNMQPHNEDALLSDWSAPPPWPIFIGLNVIAGGLRAAADALTPPPFKMLDMALGFHHTILVHVAQKFKIPDVIAAEGPLSAAVWKSTSVSGAPIIFTDDATIQHEHAVKF